MNNALKFDTIILKDEKLHTKMCQWLGKSSQKNHPILWIPQFFEMQYLHE